MNQFLIGILAGLVSALLAAPLAAGAVTPLMYFIPLPVFIVTLCWKHQTGLIAVCVAGLALFAGTMSYGVPLVFALCFGLPGWGIAYLYMLGRNTGTDTDWYPLGYIMAWIGAIAAILTILTILVVSGGTYQGYENAMQALADYFEPTLKALFGNAYDRETYLIALRAQFIPSQAIWIVLDLVLNLWLSVKIATRMNRITRPRPVISAMRMPPFVVGMALAGFALSYLGGLIGVSGLSIRVAAVTVLMLQGLAFVHVTSHNARSRKLFLFFLYAFLVVTAILGVALPAYILVCVGAADILFDIRKKFGTDGPAPPANP